MSLRDDKMKDRKEQNKTNLNYFYFQSIIVLLLFMFSFFPRLTVLDYPTPGDTIAYAELTKNLAEESRYTSPVYDQPAGGMGNPVDPLLADPTRAGH